MYLKEKHLSKENLNISSHETVEINRTDVMKMNFYTNVRREKDIQRLILLLYHK